jgi:diguanylate cyclase (GGDEF)-like protein
VLNWTFAPDLVAVGLLTAAFVSVARRNQSHHSRIWLIGWMTILLHFGALLFTSAPGVVSVVAYILAVSALAWAGLLFMWASVPHREEDSSRLLLLLMLAANTFFFAVLIAAPEVRWSRNLGAFLLGGIPLFVTLFARKQVNSPLRWSFVAIYCALSAFLLAFQFHPGNGAYLSLNAPLFTVYAGCCVHFWFEYRRPTAGAFITIAAFTAWASVFLVAPLLDAYAPHLAVQSEVWNLPKFVVAVGMILLLLEDQIEHNQHLALHDHLTGLPNRRLYQDRLARTLERARRTGSQAALLVIDLDSFKEVNDTLGHHVGDLVLKKVSELFSSRIRRSDTVARTGGDEFSVILEVPTSRQEAIHVGKSLIEMFREPFEIGESVVQIGASVGIAIFPEDAKELESLCIAADLRMYRSKCSTRNSPSLPVDALTNLGKDSPPELQVAD